MADPFHIALLISAFLTITFIYSLWLARSVFVSAWHTLDRLTRGAGRRIFSRRFFSAMAALVFVLLCLNPPWRITVTDDKGHAYRTEIRSSWITDSPRAGYTHETAHIATDVLVIEWICFAAVVLTGHYLLPRPKP